MQKFAKRTKRVGSDPSPLQGRNERGQRISESYARRTGGVQRTPLAHDHTGAFGSFRSPKLVGVSDEVRVASRDLARRAKKAEKAWLRSLPSGVRV